MVILSIRIDTNLNQLLIPYNVLYVAVNPMAQLIKSKHWEGLFNKNTNLQKLLKLNDNVYITICVFGGVGLKS